MKQWTSSKEGTSFFEKVHTALEFGISLSECALYLAALLGRESVLHDRINSAEIISVNPLWDFHFILFGIRRKDTLAILERMSRSAVKILQDDAKDLRSKKTINGRFQLALMLQSYLRPMASSVEPMDWAVDSYWCIRDREHVPAGIALDRARKGLLSLNS